ncbi:hypothetical protein PAPYR_13466 [Paratrimastix pyriformis]|uniref:Uncharacterized protein n=1 Tax=Paratrimastix pyriformis TaxID=342808 RepID=A0ABQ8U074_9EUKA|nr:hypothetical protein PAPYR_13466 [Paratrimastix pyriformis]
MHCIVQQSLNGSENAFEARKFFKTFTNSLGILNVHAVFKRGGVLPTGEPTVYLAFPPGACFHPGIFRSQLLFVS